jgi:hypothetical protein
MNAAVATFPRADDIDLDYVRQGTGRENPTWLLNGNM